MDELTACARPMGLHCTSLPPAASSCLQGRPQPPAGGPLPPLPSPPHNPPALTPTHSHTGTTHHPPEPTALLKPMPIDSTKGTVTGPVVTPALSQATAVTESSVSTVRVTATAYFASRK